MLYNDLHELINGSASTRAYFLSLPVPLQMLFDKQNQNF